jgi:RNA polymerase sigma-70 factor (ECF subfamily)
LAFNVHMAGESPWPRDRERADARDFVALYDGWFRAVYRWVRALGCPEADLEDVTQEVFVIAQRKLAAFDGENVSAWLYRIATRTVRDYRRHSWFRNVFLRPRDVELDDLRDRGRTPAELIEEKEATAMVRRAVARMSPKWRTTFVLFEIEGFSGDEIARFQEVPVATIWTHLHRARKEFRSLVGQEQAGEVP